MATKHRHEFTIIHPLRYKLEQHVDMDRLAPRRLRNAVRWSLITLRACMVLMIILALYRVAGLTGLATH